MQPDTDKIDDAVLALLYLTLQGAGGLGSLTIGAR
jgi:hypothetical protein